MKRLLILDCACIHQSNKGIVRNIHSYRTNAFCHQIRYTILDILTVGFRVGVLVGSGVGCLGDGFGYVGFSNPGSG